MSGSCSTAVAFISEQAQTPRAEPTLVPPVRQCSQRCPDGGAVLESAGTTAGSCFRSYRYAYWPVSCVERLAAFAAPFRQRKMMVRLTKLPVAPGHQRRQPAYTYEGRHNAPASPG